MKTKRISIGEVEYVAFDLAKKLMTYNEPIPDFGTRFPNILESCVETPFTTYSRQDLYRGLVGKASALFYLMIKNHPFQNGNKRIAVMTLLYFLHKNGKWLDISKESLYQFARGIAKSRSSSHDKINIQIRATLNKYLVNF